MFPRRLVTTLLLVQLLAFAASAQEFARATGGEIELKTKGEAPISGSLGISLTSGNDVLGLGRTTGYGMTIGGTLIRDRLWFFASGVRQQSTFAGLELPENVTTGAIGARVDGQIGASQDFSAFFESARRPAFSATVPSSMAAIAPSSFLSLRYTGIVSSNMFFTTSFTRSSVSVQNVP